MNKGIVAIVLLVAGIWASSAFALDMMGPPAAGLMENQWSVGLNYSYSESDLKAKNGNVFTSKDNKLTKTFAVLSYGITNNWEVYGLLGGAKMESGDFVYEGGYRSSGGGGTKVTVCQEENWKWGGLFQIAWDKSRENWRGERYYDDAEWYEWQLAAGPVYMLNDKVSLYGGPFYNSLKGEFESNTSGEHHFRDRGHLGLYVGAQFTINDYLSLNAEYQVIDDAVGTGFNLTWKF